MGEHGHPKAIESQNEIERNRTETWHGEKANVLKIFYGCGDTALMCIDLYAVNRLRMHAFWIQFNKMFILMLCIRTMCDTSQQLWLNKKLEHEESEKKIKMACDPKKNGYKQQITQCEVFVCTLYTDCTLEKRAFDYVWVSSVARAPIYGLYPYRRKVCRNERAKAHATSIHKTASRKSFGPNEKRPTTTTTTTTKKSIMSKQQNVYNCFYLWSKAQLKLKLTVK